MQILNDLYRIAGKKDRLTFIKTFFKNNGFRYLFYWRKIKNNSKLKYLYKILINIESKISGLEIPYTVEIGDGALLLHAYGITINSKAIIGNNLVILKGATIGNTKRGIKKGAPIIGNNVYVGLNSTIVGAVNIGDDVLIAPNSYVNFDVPSHSIVIGNPGIIHTKEFATKEYINNCI